MIRFALSVLALAWGVTSTASAQQSWVVTEVRAGDASTDSSQSALRVTEILRSRGIPVIDGRAAASELEHKHSRTPVRLQPEELARLDAALRTLADHLASENLPEARTALEAVERLTPDARDYLNRQVNRARRRFHTCLLAAHLFAKEGYDDDAFQQVRKCARDFPGFEPEEGAYMPESIKSFFSRAREEMQTIRPASLDVGVDVEAGMADRCRVRVNGIDKGTAPAKIVEVRAEAVRVQLECDGRTGRIYSVPIHPGDNSITLDPRLDQALDTRSTLVLHYPDAQEARELRVEHGLEIARAIGASHMLQVFGGKLTRLDVATHTEVAEADLSEVSLEDGVHEVLDAKPSRGALLAGSDPPRRDDSSRGSSVFAPLAWVSLSGAVIAGATTFVGWRVREGAAEDFNDEQCLDGEDPTRPTRASKCADALGTVHTGEAVMLAAGISAGVFAGLATLFFVLDANSGDSIESASATASLCTSGPGEVGIACRVQF